MGMSFEKPVRHLREYLSVLGPLLRGERASFDRRGVPGPRRALDRRAVSSRCRCVVAALGEQMLKVTARLADGTVTWCTGPGRCASHIVPDDHRRRGGGRTAAPRVVAALPVCVTDDRAGAQRAGRRDVSRCTATCPSYRAMLDREGVAGPADIAIVGSAAEVTERMLALGEIGVTEFVAVEFPADADEAAATRETLRSLL